ncbi:uncharacterized protein TNCV_2460701 [Trichonephila clavipes]|nr:uncharacterized protein TNCV_2460701 [Trichonephila clavipes]
MGNSGMTSSSPHAGTGIFLYQIQGILLIVWRLCSSHTFLCVHDEESTVGKSLVQACKDGVAGSSPPGVTMDAQPLFHASIAISLMLDAYQRAQRSCNVPFAVI